MKIALQLMGNVNGSPFEVRGDITGEQGGGSGRAEVKALTPLPKGFEISLLPYCLLTGQPSLSGSTAGAVNPFISTGGVYTATRTLDLGAHGFLSTKYGVRREDSGLVTYLHISGHTAVPKLARIDPCIETWIPSGPGEIAGHFTMVWLSEKGTGIKGEADTLYTLPIADSLPAVQYRYIQIDIKQGDDWITQDERIVLYTTEAFSRAFSGSF